VASEQYKTGNCISDKVNLRPSTRVPPIADLGKHRKGTREDDNRLNLTIGMELELGLKKDYKLDLDRGDGTII
jgi:hypothetical protein